MKTNRINSENYNTLNHCKFLIQYHIIWCPKFRFSVLGENVESVLKEVLYTIGEKYEFEIKELEVMPDHIHMFVSTKPTVAPTDVIRTFKSISAIEVFKRLPRLKRFYSRCGSLWSKGYFVSSVGKVSKETVKRYIQEQKSKS
ncbi:IS200/IS605 family transposase [Neobacillus pocheonensis]|uniref:IS200/IS605 family transposase n=1 Tax=Neobacillus pocheonensis TaxID=363869 RepID=A0ABT0WGQ3_9BACI|nr:IS200/IS605 family transposase [Neobacillus pocheonensis]